METAKNIQKISFIFFAVLGALFIGSGLAEANNYIPKLSQITHRIIDLPFIFCGLLYGLSSLRNTIATPEKTHKILDATLIAIGAILFLSAVLINFIYPDVF